MHRSTATVLAGALTLPLTVLSATAADAERRPRARTQSVTLKTDAMPTRVDVTSRAGRVTCVRIETGAGRERRIWLTLDGERETELYTRLGARQTSRCLMSGTSAPRGSTLSIRVEEDILGPFDPSDEAEVRL